MAAKEPEATSEITLDCFVSAGVLDENGKYLKNGERMKPGGRYSLRVILVNPDDLGSEFLPEKDSKLVGLKLAVMLYSPDEVLMPEPDRWLEIKSREEIEKSSPRTGNYLDFSVTPQSSRRETQDVAFSFDIVSGCRQVAWLRFSIPLES